MHFENFAGHPKGKITVHAYKWPKALVSYLLKLMLRQIDGPQGGRNPSDKRLLLYSD